MVRVLAIVFCENMLHSTAIVLSREAVNTYKM